MFIFRKRYIIYIAFFLLFSVSFVENAFAGEIVLDGIYRGENLYVENPYASTGVGFCVSEVLVNGNTTTDEINSSFFEIDLSIYNFRYGALLRIVIKHKDGCVPRVLNPEVLTPESTFIIKSISVDKDGFLNWKTLKEHGKLPFIVEQYRWNKWIRVGSVKGKGTAGLNQYRYGIEFHSGLNKFRVKQIGSNKKPRYSQSVEYLNNVPEVTFIPGNGGKTSQKIYFSTYTRFEIYDYYGKLVKTGADAEIDVSKLKPGTYFLNYDNKTETFTKR